MLLFQGYTSPAEQTHVYKPYQQVNNNNNKKIDYSIPRERITFQDDPLPKVFDFNGRSGIAPTRNCNHSLKNA
jgi:hypothetical protein